MLRLRAEGGLSGLSELVIRVIEGQNLGPNRAERRPARRSPEAARCLVGLARAIHDPELKASLDRLATTLGTEVTGVKGACEAP